jgi:hypothetical protein
MNGHKEYTPRCALNGTVSIWSMNGLYSCDSDMVSEPDMGNGVCFAVNSWADTQDSDCCIDLFM